MAANILGIHPKTTWLDIIARNTNVQHAITETPYSRLYLLDTEPQIPHTVELLGSSRFGELIQKLRNTFEVIIFDTPPINRFIDVAVLAPRVDGTLLVINATSSTIEEEREALAQLKKANAFILGAVLNNVKNSKKDDYYYYYYRDRDGKHGKRRKSSKEKA